MNNYKENNSCHFVDKKRYVQILEIRGKKHSCHFVDKKDTFDSWIPQKRKVKQSKAHKTNLKSTTY